MTVAHSCRWRFWLRTFCAALASTRRSRRTSAASWRTSASGVQRLLDHARVNGMRAVLDMQNPQAMYSHTHMDVHHVRRSFPKLETTLDWVLQLYWVILPALVGIRRCPRLPLLWGMPQCVLPTGHCS